ncbi:7-cyano-7-deazaguanine synthase QueC [Mesorhizobium carmichaelinearum]|uniref:7-cyano-7-deazaguanine synthase QueC n=1 Tax=Mesorhizobium carmichaelinearum TaxID=1208188 RepID=UPI000BA361CA|nr:7-cyano-7-deazaguanine synthase QueC [Mesorhizobium carmichaelinearum]
MNALVICSGGLDSVSLAHRVATEQKLIGLLSFDYGQRHKKELGFASMCAKRLGVRHQIVDIGDVGRNLSGSALTDTVDVPDGHYAEDSMRITVVPNRNAIMLAIAFGVAAVQQADAVAIAVHGGDHFIYPDCRPAFVDAFQTMQNQALAGYADIRLYAPYVNMSKADIVSEGARYDTPFEATWSCYKGGERHCGRCGTCVERREAFNLAGIADPTDYEDADFWLNAIQTRSA